MSTVMSRLVLAVCAFAVLAIAIVIQPPKSLNDFDQSFYLTIAYDIEHHGVFTNGIFDTTDSTRETPQPGMFFVPGYPLLLLATMKTDPRFARAVDCSVDANHNRRDGSECEIYATPILIIHAFLLTLAVLAIAMAGETMFGSALVFWLSGALATAGLVTEADLFSFVMTESLTISLYSITMLFAALAWKRMHRLD